MTVKILDFTMSERDIEKCAWKHLFPKKFMPKEGLDLLYAQGPFAMEKRASDACFEKHKKQGTTFSKEHMDELAAIVAHFVPTRTETDKSVAAVIHFIKSQKHIG